MRSVCNEKQLIVKEKKTFQIRKKLSNLPHQKQVNLISQSIYLRQSFECGIPQCSLCTSFSTNTKSSHLVLLPDETVLLTYYEFFMEFSSSSSKNQLNVVCVLESVLEQYQRLIHQQKQQSHSQLAGFYQRKITLLKQNMYTRQQNQASDFFTFFPNQHFHKTYQRQRKQIVRIEDIGQKKSGLETIEAQYERELVAAVSWYQDHLDQMSNKESSHQVIFLTNDPLRMKNMQQNNCQAYSLDDFLQEFDKMEEYTELCDSMKRNFESESAKVNSIGGISSERKDDLARYKIPSVLKDEYDQYKIFKGRIEISEYNPTEAFVSIPNYYHSSEKSGETFFIVEKNHTLHDDIVYIKVLPESEWQMPQSQRNLVRYYDIDSTIDVNSSPCQTEIICTDTSVVPTAYVVGLDKRSTRPIVATILKDDVENLFDSSDLYHLAVPMDIRYPKIRVKTQQITSLANKRLVVTIDQWRHDSFYPDGHYTQILGNAGDLDTEIQSLLIEYKIPIGFFSEAAVACLPQQRQLSTTSVDVTLEKDSCSKSKNKDNIVSCLWDFDGFELANELSFRRDIRTSHEVFSIDPIGCEDIDDAMSIRQLPSGNIELAVHIADVSYFIPENCSLDKAARDRGTSVYFADRRYNMIPTLLSSNLCSLHHGVDRLAVSVFFELEIVGETEYKILEEKTWFGRTLIHSIAAMTYEQADELFMTGKLYNYAQPKNSLSGGAAGTHYLTPEIERSMVTRIKELVQVARCFHRQRANTGAMELSTEKEEIKFAIQQGKKNIIFGEALEMHEIIAELMILANQTVAAKILCNHNNVAVIRRHVPPAANRFEKLLALANEKGFDFETNSNFTLQKSLDSVEHKCERHVYLLLRDLITRAMSEAQYLSAQKARDKKKSSNEVGPYYHYGLGLETYTHFTSPIRRYADILVHRLLLSNNISLDEKETDEICTHLNHQNRQAKLASRACQELFLALFFAETGENTIYKTAEATISELKDNGVLIYVPTFQLKGAVILPVTKRTTTELTVLWEDVNPPLYLRLKRLDKIQVKICCNLTKAKARLPQLEYEFVLPIGGSESGRKKTQSVFTSQQIQQDVYKSEQQKITRTVQQGRKDNLKLHHMKGDDATSLYTLLHYFNSHLPEDSKKRAKTKNSKHLITRKSLGRLVIGGFKLTGCSSTNLSSRSKELEKEMMIPRYSTEKPIRNLKQMEQKMQQRMTKLALEKRHDRINKQKKRS